MYEFLTNGDVFTDGSEKADSYTSTKNLTYVGRIDSDGEFHFDDEYRELLANPELVEDEIRNELADLIIHHAETAFAEWAPSQELMIFSRQNRTA